MSNEMSSDGSLVAEKFGAKEFGAEKLGAEENAKPSVAALIVAAGTGSRVGDGIPKQYRPVGGIPLLRRTVSQFSSCPTISDILVVIGEGQDTLADAALLGLDKVATTPGGESRQASVQAGLEALSSKESEPAIVLIHDAARPFASVSLIENVAKTAGRVGGAVPVLKVMDALLCEEHDGSLSTGPERSQIRRAQTPQGFRFPEILAAHRTASSKTSALDDTEIASSAGMTVAAVSGEEQNFKITEPGDFARAEAYLAMQREIRIGFGYDVHRFQDGTAVRLCGVDIPHDRSLAGHSDADVALHAATDAILGAIAAGDIGSHFPPSDQRWAGADSARFLEHASAQVTEKDGSIQHLDITVICERPKIGPHRDAMRKRVAEILNLSPGRISVKATTTEKLGFTGRGEGIAAEAVATVSLPTDRG